MDGEFSAMYDDDPYKSCHLNEMEEIKQEFVLFSNIWEVGIIEITPFTSTNLCALSDITFKVKKGIRYPLLPFGGAFLPAGSSPAYGMSLST